MLKNSAFSALVMTAILFGGVEANAALKINDKGVNTGVLKDVYSGVKFTYYDRQDRLLILNDFLRATELEYALLPLKKDRIGLDFEKIKNEAIALETAVEDIVLSPADRKNEEAKERVSQLQAEKNMEFLDRMQLLVAKFKDTHFSLQERTPRPYVYTGLRFARVDNKIILARIDNKFMQMVAKLTSESFDEIKIGDEVVSIDGVDVEKKVAELKAFIPGSTEEFIDSEAVRSLTLRRLNYEKKNYIKVVFKKGGAFKLPLFANSPVPAPQRTDSAAYFKKYGIPFDTSSIGMTYDYVNKKWVDTNINMEGYIPVDIHQHLKGVTTYTDDSGSPAIRTGYYIAKGKTYGVIQLLTFYSVNAKNGDNKPVPFLDPIRNFLIELKENGAPLIFDLRQNNGGNGNFPASILGMFAPENTTYPDKVMGIRVTHYMRQLEETSLFEKVAGEDQSSGLTADQVREMIDNAVENRTPYPPMYASKPIKTDAKVAGFPNKIVALVTANCISACDIMSAFLKSTKRATLIGTHSNGTGAGFRSSSLMKPEWTDSLKVFSSSIPNFLFGGPGGAITESVFEADSVSRLCSENRPTVADVSYSVAPLDVAKNNLGWLQKAVSVLESAQ